MVNLKSDSDVHFTGLFTALNGSGHVCCQINENLLRIVEQCHQIAIDYTQQNMDGYVKPPDLTDMMLAEPYLWYLR